MNSIMRYAIIILLFILSRPAQAQLRQEIDSLHRLIKVSKDDTLKILRILEMGQKHKMLNEEDSALILGKQAVDLADRILSLTKDEKILTKIKRLKAEGYSTMADNSKDRIRQYRYYCQSYNVYKDCSDSRGMSTILGSESDLCSDIGVYDKALEFSKERLNLSVARKDTDEIVSALLQLAEIQSILKNYDSGISYIRQSIKYQSTSGSTNKMSNNLKIMQLFSKKNFCDSARYYSSLVLADTFPENELTKNMQMLNIADIYISCGDTMAALAISNQAISYFMSIRFETMLVAGYSLMARYYLKLGQINKAQNLAYAALRYIESLKGKTSEIIHTQNTVSSFSIDKTLIELYNYRLLADIYKEKKDYALALRYEVLNRHLTDSLLSRDQEVRANNLQQQFQMNREIERQDIKAAEAKRELQRQSYIRLGLTGGIGLVIFFLTFLLFQMRRVQREKKRGDDLLLNILPVSIADELKTKGKTDAQMYEDVTVMFTDFVDFTRTSERLTPKALVDELNHCFSEFDTISTKYNIEKIKTMGDGFIAASGLPTESADHAIKMVLAACEMRDFMLSRKKQMREQTFEIRIGLHSGRVVAGIVGVKKFAYDIWGDTVNTAARMEQKSEGGKINISESTYLLVKDIINCEYRGEIEAKNKGKLKMYFVS